MANQFKRIMSIDIETYSDISLPDCGVYKYVDSADFHILLFAYAFDDEDVTVIDLSKQDLPDFILDALVDDSILKTAFNANFERACIGKYTGLYMEPSQWQCTMVLAMMAGYPGSLDMVSKALGLPQDKLKDSKGKRLIRYFCQPCSPTKSNGYRTFNTYHDSPEKWADFIEYCRQDVVVEREIRKAITYKITDFEKELWAVDQRICDRGVRIDINLAENAYMFNTQFIGEKIERAKEITGLENPNSVLQMKKWIEDNLGCEIEGLSKNNVKELIQSITNPLVLEALKIRLQTSKTSIKKYEKMLLCACSDDRARGILQFYGAGRSGRWAGRLIQMQNLAQNHLADLDDARQVLSDGDYDSMNMLWDIPDALSQLVRTAIIPSEGMRFLVSDFSAIEARVIAWLADEKWRQDVFAGSGKIYEASASSMFGVPVDRIKKGSALRQRGKVAELACGYGGGVGALKAMGGNEIKVPDDFNGTHDDYLQDIVNRWRAASPNIVKLWWDVDKAAKGCIRHKGDVYNVAHGVSFRCSGNAMYIRLPDGRDLSYIDPKIEEHPVYSRDIITYMGMNQVTRKWERINTYGPKLVENIVQAIARSCLAVSIVNLEKAGYPILFHVHDEVITERKFGEGSLDEIYSIMNAPIDWAPGLLLRADGYECNYYMKD